MATLDASASLHPNLSLYTSPPVPLTAAAHGSPFSPPNAAPSSQGQSHAQAPAPNPLAPHVSPTTLAHLDRLHAASLAQERAIDPAEVARVGFDKYMEDKYIALDQDKCWFVYQMCLAVGARNIVEARTSFGLSTIYLALALRTLQRDAATCRVIATENEPSKAERARVTWKEIEEGSDVEVAKYIDLREGDLLETLKTDLPTVDLLLLDIWAPLALPTLKLVQSHFRKGSVVIIDNSISSAQRYADLLAYVRAPGSGYTNMTVPFSKGLEVCVFLGRD